MGEIHYPRAASIAFPPHYEIVSLVSWFAEPQFGFDEKENVQEKEEEARRRKGNVCHKYQKFKFISSVSSYYKKFSMVAIPTFEYNLKPLRFWK